MTRILLRRILITSFMVIAVPAGNAADPIEQLVAEGERRIADNQNAQEEIDRISDRTTSLISEYRTVTKIVDDLRIYNDVLEKQIADQIAEIAVIKQSIERVSLMERQIVPLMVRMIDSLEEFINLDVPFLLEERHGRVTALRQLMLRSDASAAEKLRRIVEAYQIEIQYGRTIEAYQGTIWTNGKPREVDFLRIGRIMLLYRTVGGEELGVWSGATEDWKTLPAREIKGEFAKGLRIARKQMAPELLMLPVPAPEAFRP